MRRDRTTKRHTGSDKMGWLDRFIRRKTEDRATYRLVVCVPTDGHPTSPFVYSLSHFFMALRDANHALNRWDIAFVLSDGSAIHDSREQLADKALSMGATHLLFIDDDMEFPPSAVLSLLNRKLPLVGCNYTRRKPPHVAVASRADMRGLITTTPESTGLEPAHGTGFGMVLVAREVFLAVQKPWFLPTWDYVTRSYSGEDVMFFRRAAGEGFQLQIDQDASRMIGHCSEQVLACKDMIAVPEFKPPEALEHE